MGWALSTAIHTLTLLPTTTLFFKNPFKLLFCSFPTYIHLCVFGCLCYPNLSSTAQHKLPHRSSTGVYLGPSSNHCAYCCLDLITQCVIISRHVTFDEDCFPFSDFHHPLVISDYDLFLSDDTFSLFPSTNLVSLTPTSTPNNEPTSTIPITYPVISSPSPTPSMSSPTPTLHLHQIIPWLLDHPLSLLNLSIFSISPSPMTSPQSLAPLLKLYVIPTWNLLWILRCMLWPPIIHGILFPLLLMSISLVAAGFIIISLTTKVI